MLDKYDLGKLENLTEDGKVLVIKALKSAEKKITLATVITKWRETVILILLIVVAFLWWKKLSAETELAKAKAMLNSAQQIATIDATLQQMEQHQKNLYPKLDANIKELEALRLQLRTVEGTLVGLSRDRFRKAVKDQQLTPTQLADYFKSKGYDARAIKLP